MAYFLGPGGNLSPKGLLNSVFGGVGSEFVPHSATVNVVNDAPDDSAGSLEKGKRI